MTRIEAEIHEDVVSILNKIKSVNDTGIELVIPEGSIIFENVINIKILKKEAEEYGKVLHLSTSDETGNILISGAGDEKNTEDVTIQEEPGLSMSEIQTKAPVRAKIPMPKVSTPKFNLTLPKFTQTKTPLIIVIVLLLIIGTGAAYAVNAPKAYVKIVLESQPLTKSVAVKVKKDASSSSENKILRGVSLEAEITQSEAMDTTGEKVIGKKAEGKVRIYNYDEEDKEFKKGTVLKYDDLEFNLDENVEIPAQTVDPVTLDVTPGEAEADVVASQIGPDYNIDKGKTLSVKGYKNNQFAAKSIEEFEGGESKTVKIVSKDDLTKLSELASVNAKDKASAALTAKVGRGQKLINGANKLTLISETFSAKEEEEIDKIEITANYKVQGLVYATEDIEKLMDEMTVQLIPENYTISSKDKEISAEILGNSDTTVLNTEEADIQVTVKTFVVPVVSEDQIKEDLKGKKTPEAERVLGSIRNVKTYELSIKPSIPLLSKVPSGTESIFVEILSDE